MMQEMNKRKYAALCLCCGGADDCFFSTLFSAHPCNHLSCCLNTIKHNTFFYSDQCFCHHFMFYLSMICCIMSMKYLIKLKSLLLIVLVC